MRLGFPVALKADGPLHKTEAGGVKLGLQDEREVREAYLEMAGRLGDAMTGAVVQQMIGSGVEVMGGKTGFISKAGYCLATLLRLPESDQRVAVVVLGARSNTGRFWETRHIFNWLSSQASTLFGKEHQQQIQQAY